ncbi:MAG: hypothetical protein ACD_62C00204G0004 [uncultured bacterium]|nr:MAG: hypothetical protein ACD_62C00204G0004 [uncultured bacterium]
MGNLLSAEVGVRANVADPANENDVALTSITEAQYEDGFVENFKPARQAAYGFQESLYAELVADILPERKVSPYIGIGGILSLGQQNMRFADVATDSNLLNLRTFRGGLLFDAGARFHLDSALSALSVGPSYALQWSDSVKFKSPTGELSGYDNLDFPLDLSTVVSPWETQHEILLKTALDFDISKTGSNRETSIGFDFGIGARILKWRPTEDMADLVRTKVEGGYALPSQLANGASAMCAHNRAIKFELPDSGDAGSSSSTSLDIMAGVHLIF